PPVKQQNPHPPADTNRPIKLYLSASAQVGRAFRCPPSLVACARRGTESAPYLRKRVKAWGGKITLTGEDSPDTARKSVSLSLRGAQRRPVRPSLGEGGSNPASAAKRVLPVTGRNSAVGGDLCPDSNPAFPLCPQDRGIKPLLQLGNGSCFLGARWIAIILRQGFG